MPELPEVESVRRLMQRVLVGKVIVAAEVAPDEIVLSGTPPEAVEAALVGKTVKGVGRKGKYWWIELDEKPWLFGHLGMSGWVRHLGRDTIKLHSHGKAPLDDAEGRPRFLKLLIEVEGGEQIAFTDRRRFGRLWLGDGPDSDPAISKLGFDCLTELPSAKVMREKLARRKAPIKAVLLDQGLFAGIGNWIADEVLYQSKIAPNRLANTLSKYEVTALRAAISKVLRTSVEVDADYKLFPESWLFHHRWGGGRGTDRIAGKEIVRETVGGRTTAWVPERQR
ncbi:MAG TPA: DNA-formamidopyrimidine glycosylase family protein [Fimbriimonas sp.]|nr:DNA-formamidopyrimidine glycosylase family protein [Fimbriimonas sp.]